MKRFTVYGNDRNLGIRLAHTDSMLWAYVVAYWYYFSFSGIEIFDRTGFQGMVLK